MKPHEPWSHFDEGFRAFDRGFRSIDWDAVRHTQFEDQRDPRGRKVHRLTASSWRSRFKIARLFLYLAWRIFFRGKVTVRL